MTHFAEPLVQDTLRSWLANQSIYEIVCSEVTIETGRIDLIARTREEEFHGFEVKDTAAGMELIEQLERYRDSGQLDKLYYCARSIDPFLKSLARTDGGVSIDQQKVRTAVNDIAAGIAIGDIDVTEFKETVKSALPQAAWAQEISGLEMSLGEYILENVEIPPPLTDDQKEAAQTSIGDAIQELEDSFVVRSRLNGLGVIVIPLDLYGPTIPPHYRVEMNTDPDRLFDPDRRREPQIIREAKPLTRESSPPLSRTKEPWVRYHLQREVGTFREAVLPDLESGTVRQIDIIGFKGSYNPTDIYLNQDDHSYDLIGIEAKGDSLTTGMGSKVRDQIQSYLNAGGLTRLFLGVPKVSEAPAKSILDKGGGEFADVGLLTVDKQGEIDEVRPAEKLEMEHDGFTVNGRIRAIGYGKASIQSVDEFEAIAKE